MTHVCTLPDRAVLSVSGEDRVPFLQGLVSNDVALAGPARAVWAALLTPQGKWLADFFITATAERLLLDCEAGQAGWLAQRLSRFRLRSRVEVTNAALVVQAGWGGPGSGGSHADPRLPEAGWRRVTATGELMPETATPAEYDLHRLRLGLPDGSRDMEAEKTTLLEAGFDELGGVSWTKGCYMGQELTARTKYRGLLKRRLLPVRVVGRLPAPGTPVLAGGQEVGTMRSGQEDRGLALLRLDASEGSVLHAGEATLAVERPPWLNPSPSVEASARG